MEHINIQTAFNFLARFTGITVASLGTAICFSIIATQIKKEDRYKILKEVAGDMRLERRGKTS